VTAEPMTAMPRAEPIWRLVEATAAATPARLRGMPETAEMVIGGFTMPVSDAEHHVRGEQAPGRAVIGECVERDAAQGEAEAGYEQLTVGGPRTATDPARTTARGSATSPRWRSV